MSERFNRLMLLLAQCRPLARQGPFSVLPLYRSQVIRALSLRRPI